MARRGAFVVLVTFLAVTTAQSQENSVLEEEVQLCVTEKDFGNSTFVCDTHNSLNDTTVKKLQSLLAHIEMPCTCADGCRRADGTDDFRGLIVVTQSGSSQNLSKDVSRIFRERGLGDGVCNHGVLIVYMKDTEEISFYRGGEFQRLTQEDLIKLHETAKKGTVDSEDAEALQFIVSNYRDIAQPIQRAETWTPVVGLIAAILIVLIALAILLSLFLARFCCCCARRKKEVYHVTPTPSYKPIEPIYVVTPQSGSERFPLGPHSELYSTPYSGSPLPLPFPPPPGALRPITPSTATNTRLRNRPSVLSSSTNDSPKSATRAPRMGKKAMGVVGERASIEEEPEYDHVPATTVDGTMPRGGERGEFFDSLPRPGPGVYPQGPPHLIIPGSLPRGAVMRMPPPLGSPHSDVSLRVPIPPPQHGDFAFLDPRRPLETQTREEIIFDEKDIEVEEVHGDSPKQPKKEKQGKK